MVPPVMALFKKSPLFKKSSGNGLYTKAKPNLAKKHGAPPPSPSSQDAGFPTSEDRRRGASGNSDDYMPEDRGYDPDSRFLHGELVHLTSTNVAWAQYDAASQTLYVGFHGGDKYPYRVPPHIALGLINASSAGRYVREVLRGHEASGPI